MPRLYFGQKGGIFYKKGGQKKYLNRNQLFRLEEQGLLNTATLMSQTPQNRALDSGFGIEPAGRPLSNPIATLRMMLRNTEFTMRGAIIDITLTDGESLQVSRTDDGSIIVSDQYFNISTFVNNDEVIRHIENNYRNNIINIKLVEDNGYNFL